MSVVVELIKSPHTLAVVGVSQDKTRYGYELFEVLKNHGHTVLPVNPKYSEIDGEPCYPSLADLPIKPDAVVSAISPVAAEKLAETCASLNIPVLWMPPGTDSEEAIKICEANNITAIYDICPVFVHNLSEDRLNELL